MDVIGSSLWCHAHGIIGRAITVKHDQVRKHGHQRRIEDLSCYLQTATPVELDYSRTKTRKY
eukprot:12648694-Alexandrium_andersonii.AAC.1